MPEVDQKAVAAITTLQNHRPLVRGRTVASPAVERLRPSQPPMKKAATIIRKPLRAEAAPADCGNGETAPLWPQGWCTPWPSMNR